MLFLPIKTSLFIVIVASAGFIHMQNEFQLLELTSKTAYGQEPSEVKIFISTDKPSYKIGNDIIITGKVSELESGYPVVLRIQAPNGNLILATHVTVKPDKSFSATISINNTSWENPGTYTILAQHGSEGSSKTTFELENYDEELMPEVANDQTPGYENIILPNLTSSSENNKLPTAGNWIFVSILTVIGIVVGVFLLKKKKPVTSQMEGTSPSTMQPSSDTGGTQQTDQIDEQLAKKIKELQNSEKEKREKQKPMTKEDELEPEDDE